MEKIKIDRVDAQPLETALACSRQFRVRSVVRIHFRDNKYAVALAFDGVGHDFFRAAFAVHFGCVDQSHAEFDSQTQRCDFIRVRAFFFAYPPCALAKGRDACAVGQGDHFHFVLIFIIAIVDSRGCEHMKTSRRILKMQSSNMQPTRLPLQNLDGKSV